MKEKIKQYFSNKQNVIYTCLFALLFISICLQVKILCSLRRPKFPYGVPLANGVGKENSNMKKMRKIRQMERERQRAMFRNFDRELENMMRNREKMFMDMDNIFKDDYFFANEDEWYSGIQYNKQNGKHNKNDGNKQIEVRRKFIFRPKFRELENAYVISIKVPESIKKDNVKIDLKNKNLSINITKEESHNNDTSSSYSFDSFSRVYYLKNVASKSNKDDLNIKFDKSELFIEAKKENNSRQGDKNKKNNNNKNNKGNKKK